MVAPDGRVKSCCADCADAHSAMGASEADPCDDHGADHGANHTGDPAPVQIPWWRRGVAAIPLVAALALALWHLQAQMPPRAAVADSLSSNVAAAILTDSVAASAHAPALAVSDEFGAPEPNGDHLNDLDGDADSDAEADDEFHGEGADPGADLDDIELPPTLDDLLENSEQPLEERFPILSDWVFPVTDSSDEFPLKRTRIFGAVREGVTRTECGRGHCGIDLNGPRGTPVVAVAWGVVARIRRDSDSRSGKYVRIEHPDYVYTSYMHLDDIADGLRVGDEVEPGQMLGTLGRTGILHSAPHLHFSLQLPSGQTLLHFDPLSYIVDAERLTADQAIRAE
ncbi:MAG: hypothetical protein Tsb0020_31510 [Haliangiales bacterium]